MGRKKQLKWLRALRDERDAADVIVCYAAGIDERDFEAYRACFAPDVVLDGFTPEPIHGVDAWVAFVEKTIEPFEATQHMLGPPQVAIDGDEATLRAELRAEHFYREPRGGIFTVWGTYRSRLTRHEGRWCLAHHTLEVRATRTVDASPRVAR